MQQWILWGKSEEFFIWESYILPLTKNLTLKREKVVTWKRAIESRSLMSYFDDRQLYNTFW